jgi:hypothetical protein
MGKIPNVSDYLVPRDGENTDMTGLIAEQLASKQCSEGGQRYQSGHIGTVFSELRKPLTEIALKRHKRMLKGVASGWSRKVIDSRSGFVFH